WRLRAVCAGSAWGLRTQPFSLITPCSGVFVQQGLDARDLAAHLAHPRRRFHPAGGALEAQFVELLGQLALAEVQLVDALLAEAGSLDVFHVPTSISCRLTKRVLIGSLCAARRNASSAISRVTPS